eukprot:TRINITY_DN1621_c0_g1_i2.p1 TRINITY_DN1621_c0_g1~~TRINITY_DN1621_c0_g1_i2.p1  ORF type:complete len:190 (-),score=45.45 TRINITY_DN1621_c0_g1_i2:247-816(-)
MEKKIAPRFLASAIKRTAPAAAKSVDEVAVDPRASLQLVLAYLVHHGYAHTAEALFKSAGVDPDMKKIVQRQEIIAHMRNRNYIPVIEGLEQHFPELLQKNPKVAFHLYSLQFLTLLTGNHKPEALQYAKSHLATLAKASTSQMDALKGLLSLLTYPDPQLCPDSHFLTPSYFDAGVDILQAAMMGIVE